jgi:preprotein translocase subunit SecA
MVQVLLKKLFGTKNERELKRLQPMVEEISSLLRLHII